MSYFFWSYHPLRYQRGPHIFVLAVVAIVSAALKSVLQNLTGGPSCRRHHILESKNKEKDRKGKEWSETILFEGEYYQNTLYEMLQGIITL